MHGYIYQNITNEVYAKEEVKSSLEKDGTRVYYIEENPELEDYVKRLDAKNYEFLSESSEKKYLLNDETRKQNGTVFNNIIGGDDRTIVKNTTEAPYSSVVRILANKKRGIYKTSGVMISNDLVLTCADTVDSRKNGKADWYFVSPAKNLNNYPFGTSTVAQVYVFSGWENNYSDIKNMAILRLNEPIGYKSGYRLPINSDIFRNLGVKICGYQSEKMYEHTGEVIYFSGDEIHTNIDTSNEQLGSPMFNNNNQIIGIHTSTTYYINASSGKVVGMYNSGLRINSEKLNWINKYMKDAKGVYRLYNKNNGDHLFTQSPVEFYNTRSNTWKNEGLSWLAPSKGVSVYRLYNPNSTTHYYTKNISEKDKLVKAGYRYEGVVFEAMTSNGVNVYKLYNKNSKPKEMAHYFTIKTGERDKLVEAGWKYEGVPWQVYKTGN